MAGEFSFKRRPLRRGIETNIINKIPFYVIVFKRRPLRRGIETNIINKIPFYVIVFKRRPLRRGIETKESLPFRVIYEVNLKEDL